MSRLLLILPSSTYRATDFVDAAARVGAEVVVASDQRQALADAMGDRSLELDLSAPSTAAKTIVEHAATSPLDGIVAVDDPGVVVASLAAAELGLPHAAPEAVARTRDKIAMRRALDGIVPQPRFEVLTTTDVPAAVAERVGLPAVIKPVSLSASRGVIRVDTPDEAVAATDRIRTILDCADSDRDEPLLVEAFVAGREVAVEGLVRGGELIVLAVFDKPDPLDGPYFEETLYVTPSREAPGVLEAIHEVTGRAVARLGLAEGPIHAELRIGDDGTVTFLEVAARTIGGLCARSLRFGLGVSLEELVVRHALGLDLDTLRREPAASGVMMLPIPQAGVLRRVGGLDEARAVPGVVGIEITVPSGRDVQPLPEGDRYLGFAFARGERPEDVETALREAHRRLRVHIEPAGD